uniref:threonine/serine exporter family protein n=1 Tax=Anaerotignum lactatifermentans TaxID=160404 RepID=UPI003AB8B584
NMDMIVIGSIVPLLPGVPLTNSIRDFLNGDYLSGTIRMIDAVLVACCIALGVGIVLSAFQMLTGITLL